MKILMLHGVNADMFQYRNPQFYGGTALEDVNRRLQEEARLLGAEVECLQSNHAGVLVDKIHEAFFNGTDAILINPGGFTNCDGGIKEALAMMPIPVVEIHMANLFKKKNGTPQGFTTQAADAVIMGMQLESYPLALRAAIQLVNEKKKRSEQT